MTDLNDEINVWLAYAGFMGYALVVVAWAMYLRRVLRPRRMVRGREILAVIRAVYASPTLQQQVAAEMGRPALSNVPPLGATVLSAFGKDSKQTFRARLRKRKIVAYVWSFLMSGSMLATVYTAPAALMLVFVFWLGVGLLFTGLVGWFNEKESEMECVCCSCGLSTKHLRQARERQAQLEDPYNDGKDANGSNVPRIIVDHEQQNCSNCRGTAICKLGCRGCAASLVEATVVGSWDNIQSNTANRRGSSSSSSSSVTAKDKERKALAEALVLHVV